MQQNTCFAQELLMESIDGVSVAEDSDQGNTTVQGLVSGHWSVVTHALTTLL